MFFGTVVRVDLTDAESNIALPTASALFSVFSGHYNGQLAKYSFWGEGYDQMKRKFHPEVA